MTQRVDSCANNATLNLAGGTLENKGTINVLSLAVGGVDRAAVEEAPRSGAHRMLGACALDRERRAFVDRSAQRAGTALCDLAGAFCRCSSVRPGREHRFAGFRHRRFAEPLVECAFGLLKFTGKAGESLAVIAGASRTGELASVSGNAIKGGLLHYVPHYTATGVNLVVE
jgi:hypothetical protein